MSAHLTRRFRLATALLWAVACLAGFSAPAEATRLTGRFTIQASDGGSAQVWFNCEGENPCRGTYMAALPTTGCAHEYGRVDTVTVTGLNLSKPGAVSGRITLAALDDQSVRHNLRGLCQFPASAQKDFTAPFTGTWDGTRTDLVSAGTDGASISGAAALVTRLAHVTGTLTPAESGTNASMSFSCQGENPCTGTATVTHRETGCSNSNTYSDRLVLSGLNLASTGHLSGRMMIRNSHIVDQRNPNGTCTYTVGSARDAGSSFGGSWSGSSGSLYVDMGSFELDGSFRASFVTLPATRRAPIFEMTVTSSITPTVSSATANIQYRPQDVGTTGSVYAFAVAPQSMVKAGIEAPFVVGQAKSGGKDTAVACVLAQLNSSGQLQAVSASSLQAYVSGVLSSQGQAVKVIDGVATVNITGATFYVGYGSSASAMINGGINRSVVTVPGAEVCQPQAPQTGWWWNQAENGRGYTIETSGNIMFFAAYLYDAAGRATWYISAGPTSLDGSLYVGNLEYYTGGQTLTGAWHAPNRPPTIAGQVTLAFSDAHHGTLTWPGGTVAIYRMEYGVGGVNAVAQPNQPESGWWWNAGEDGRAFFVEWQAGIAAAAAYMYEADGHPVWYLAATPTTNARLLAATWQQYANGQTLTGAYQPATMLNPSVGPLSVTFTGPKEGLMTLPGGRQVPITRFAF